MTLKGVTNVVELKTFGSIAEAAADCVQVVFELIKTTQVQIVAPLLLKQKFG